jgi:hypothetical protein
LSQRASQCGNLRSDQYCGQQFPPESSQLAKREIVPGCRCYGGILLGKAASDSAGLATSSEASRRASGHRPELGWAFAAAGQSSSDLDALLAAPRTKAIGSSLFFYPIKRPADVETGVSEAVADAPATLDEATQMQRPPHFVPATGKVVTGIRSMFDDSGEGEGLALAHRGARADWCSSRQPIHILVAHGQ